MHRTRFRRGRVRFHTVHTPSLRGESTVTQSGGEHAFQWLVLGETMLNHQERCKAKVLVFANCSRIGNILLLIPFINLDGHELDATE